MACDALTAFGGGLRSAGSRLSRSCDQPTGLTLPSGCSALVSCFHPVGQPVGLLNRKPEYSACFPVILKN